MTSQYLESEASAARRQYKRRTDDERIADLERRIVEIKQKQAAKERKQDPVVREIPKIQKRLRKFAQMAMDHNRPDIANSITAFTAGLDRIVQSDKTSARASESAS